MTDSHDPDEVAVLGLARELVAKAEERLTGQTTENVLLRAQLEDAAGERDQALAAYRKVSIRLKSAEASAASVKQMYSALSRRRVVRVSLRAAGFAKPVYRFVRRMRDDESAQAFGHEAVPDAVVSDAAGTAYRSPWRLRSEMVRALKSRPSGDCVSTGPMVSIIVLTRNGRVHLERLFPALAATAYRDFEVIVVDNASSDGTDDFVSRRWPFPVRVLRNEHNRSFSEANNQGAEIASGELLLLLNNDIEPTFPSWLGVMVRALEEDPGRVAVGALLAYPEMGEASDFTVQHRGIELVLMNGAPYARNLKGSDPAAPEWAGTYEVEAATAAALLLRRNTYHGVGGLDTRYIYGSEDVDLCLRLRAHGSIAIAGDAVLFHYESASQRQVKSEVNRINRGRNWQQFAEFWGPQFTRYVKRKALSDPGPRNGSRRIVAITLTHDDPSRGYGDFYTAHELGDAFERNGWTVVYAERYADHWYDLERADLVISLIDAFDVRRAPAGAVTVAWVRNWTDRWLAHPWFDEFDVVFVGSSLGARAVGESSRFVPEVLPLATNPEHFSPGDPVPTFAADYVFTGNNWGVGRRLLDLMSVRKHERFLLFGKGWETAPRYSRYWRGHLDYDLLPQLYRSASIVLDDTASPTLPHGFVNGRVFDALAAGTLVISNNVVGSHELFDGELPTYRSREELRTHLDRFLGDDELRLDTARRLRARVIENHTYDQLPAKFLAAAVASVEQPRIAIKIGVPDPEQAEQWGDTHFARGLAHALAMEGFTARIHLLPDWDRLEHQGFDVAIHLHGLTSYTPKDGQFNVMWIISHPDELLVGECDDFDLILVASHSFAAKLAAQTTTPVVYMPQATDSRRFRPGLPERDLSEELLFVGNSRKAHRHGVDWALERELPLAVYGADWDGQLGEDVVRDSYIPNKELSRYYASAKVVLNDHWPDMAEHGFISNRIFDVLGSGGVVVSDHLDELLPLFSDIVPTYRSAEELERIVYELLDDEDKRRELGQRGARLVAQHHTFENRAQQLASLLRSGLAGRDRSLDGDYFNSDVLSEHGSDDTATWTGRTESDSSSLTATN